ncbi:MAG: T9SS type A sorting domain-containing protein [Lewinellaceae bacterium]|nr:T9SS type A sorting domain-containing protein [Lewinellaceae bacterium]
MAHRLHRKLMISFFTCIIYMLQAQHMDTIIVDFGDNLSPAPINNLADPAAGMIADLTNQKGNATGYSIAVTDAFNNINRNGTTNPDPALGLPATATGDSFFGNVADFGGQSQPTGAVTFSHLDPTLVYSFSIFASRDATDNREAMYTATGSTTISVFLNAASNASQVASFQIKPDAGGNIVLSAEPGPNNSNGSKFYYLGAVTLIYPEQNEPTVVTKDSILIDFGDNLSPLPWLNLTDPQAGVLENLTTKHGKETGYNIAVTDAFNNINRDGTVSPDPSTGMISTASADSFFGNVVTFGGQEQPTAAVTISNLTAGNAYTLSMFASRTATDNRETKYVIEGASIDSVFLNVASNTSVVVTSTMIPDQDGNITLKASPGPNNTNGSKFYYLGALIISYEEKAPPSGLDTLLIDFGDNLSLAPWNNIQDPVAGEIVDIPNSQGLNSGYGIKISDPFNNINRDGTVTPNPDLGIPVTASADSFFGNVASFGGQEQPTGAAQLYNLNVEKEYTLTIFASRTATDNRETKYLITGSTVDSLFLNVASNTDKVVTSTLKPASDGTITILASPGPNNTNASKFFYLGALKVMYASEATAEESVTVLQPNGGEVWQAGRNEEIRWKSRNIAEVNIEYSNNNGADWKPVGKASGLSGKYTWSVPNDVTSQALVRVSGNTASDQSDATFTITDEVINCTIVVLGSSTAEGTGASPRDSSWVNKYAASLSTDSRFKVVNLAKGGYTTYHIVPTGTVSSGISIVPDTTRNITKALSYQPYAIIVNMPSNDAVNNFGLDQQMRNFDLIVKAAQAEGVQTFICTTQPRNLGSQSQIDIQTSVRDAIFSTYGDHAIDFWTGIAASNGFILSQYDSGDGIHLNNEGHDILFHRVVDKRIDTLSCKPTGVEDVFFQNDDRIKIFPNPNPGSFYVAFDDVNIKKGNIQVVDLLGRLIKTTEINQGDTLTNIQMGEKVNGIYTCIIKIDTIDGKSIWYSKRMVIE